MPIRDSITGTILHDYSIAELRENANLMRGYNLVALHAAGSGHAGGTLSMMDITAALYLKVAEHRSQQPYWPDRDRIIWSTGHKAPSLYLGLAFAGFYPVEEVVTLRKLRLALPRASALAEAARRGSLNRLTRSRPQHRGGYRAGGPPEQPELQDLLHYGRR